MTLDKTVVTDPEIASVVGTDSKFEVYLAEEAKAIEMFQQGGFDILIIGQNVSFHGSEKSVSAMDALDKAVIKYDENRLLSYCPVKVKLSYDIVIIIVFRKSY